MVIPPSRSVAPHYGPEPIMTVPSLFKTVPANMDATIHIYFGKIPFHIPVIVVILTEVTLGFCDLYLIG